MPRFRVQVVEWQGDTCVIVATHEQEAPDIASARLLLARDYCGGRTVYDPTDSRPYVSAEGWKEITE